MTGEHHERWLDQMEPMSPKVRDLVRKLTTAEGFYLDDVNGWRIVLVRHDFVDGEHIKRRIAIERTSYGPHAGRFSGVTTTDEVTTGRAGSWADVWKILGL